MCNERRYTYEQSLKDCPRYACYLSNNTDTLLYSLDRYLARTFSKHGRIVLRLSLSPSKIKENIYNFPFHLITD